MSFINDYRKLLEEYHKVIHTKTWAEDDKREMIAQKMDVLLDKMSKKDRETCYQLQWEMYQEGLK